MPKNTWLENSSEAIKAINTLDSAIRKAKLNYQNALLHFGKESSQATGFYTVLQQKIQYREGFKAACDMFSK